MKYTSLLIVLSLLMLKPFCAYADMHALLIGIGEYQPGSGWNDLSSENDLVLMREALERRGFRSEAIRTLKNEEATYQGIVDAIKALIRELKRGDMVVFHFSGHGQQVMDELEGDELDGFDEAIVPYDSPIAYREGVYEGERLIRDDLLEHLFHLLRLKLGRKGQLLVILDSCHSGTGTRGFNRTRGTNLKMAPESYIKESLDLEKDRTPFLEDQLPDLKKMAPIIAFFGSGADELNYEMRADDGTICGPLSYAFSRSFSRIDEYGTYRMLFEKIRLDMAARSSGQHPQAEGALDKQIFRGKVVSPPRYFVVEDWYGEHQIRIEGGQLAGHFPGTEMQLCLPGQPERVVATGEVQFADIVYSVIELKKALPKEKARGLHAYIQKQGFGKISVSVMLTGADENPFWAILKKEIAKRKAIKIVEEDPNMILEIARENEQTFFKISFKDERVLFKEPLTALDADEFFAEWILEELFNHLRAGFLRKLETPNSGLRAGLEMIRAGKEKSIVDIRQPLMIGKDSVKLKIINDSDIPVYFNVLDIWPNDRIEVLIPVAKDGRTPADYKIAAGASMVLPTVYEFQPPAGLEVFKLIVSDRPMDLRKIVSTRGGDTISYENPYDLNDLFPWIYDVDGNMSRGQPAPAFSPAFIAVSSIVFELRE